MRNKKNYRYLFLSLIAVAIAMLFSACPPAVGSGSLNSPTGDFDDPIPMALGSWKSFSLSAKVLSGSATDQKYYSVTVPTTGTYILECSDLSGTVEPDFWWAIDGIMFSLAQGQYAGDSKNLTPATYKVLIRNDAATAMSGKIRLVLLSASGIYIPSEGSASTPITFIDGSPHTGGKVGKWTGSEAYRKSYYSFTLPADVIPGEMTISLTPGSGSNLLLSSYPDGTYTGTPTHYVSNSMPISGLKDTVFYIIVEDSGTSSTGKPVFTLSIVS